ncbi:EAL domain-containing protein [Candidatus Burkholderia verschuerenii]|nr:EAL domain-containing protein [Candidatus Burkholderia verschuerenii]
MSQSERVEPKFLLVELHNHAHLRTVFGASLAHETMRILQLRVQFCGGSVTEIGEARFLVSFLKSASPAASTPGMGSLPRLERLQIELAASLVTESGSWVLPMVTVDPVRPGLLGGESGGFLHYPEKVERVSAAGSPIRVPQFGSEWRESYERDMALAVAFERAIAHGRVSLVTQPIVRLDQHSTLLYSEALLRVSGLPDGAGAARLIPVLERLGFVRALDRIVVSNVIGRLEADSSAILGCNISACSLVMDSWWLSTFDRLMADSDVAARLTIEITETAPIADFDAAINFARRLKDLGCRISLDDFGEGHSSVSFARAIRPDVIKLYDGWVRGNWRGDDEMSVLHRLAALCGALAPCVVAEGIECEEDLQKVFGSGIDWIQGEIIQPSWKGSHILLNRETIELLTER